MKKLERIIWILFVVFMTTGWLYSSFWYERNNELAWRNEFMIYMDRLQLMELLNEEKFDEAVDHNQEWLRFKLNDIKVLGEGDIYTIRDVDYELILSRVEERFPELLEPSNKPSALPAQVFR